MISRHESTEAGQDAKEARDRERERGRQREREGQRERERGLFLTGFLPSVHPSIQYTPSFVY
jgi:hypothetical protein